MNCSTQGTACQIDSFLIPSRRETRQAALRLSWEARGGELLLTLPEGQHDVRPFAAIQLRAALDGHEALRSGAQALHLELRDAAGGRAAAIVPATTLALQPPTTTLRDADKPNPFLSGNAPLATVRVPLSQLAGADLSQVESLALVFDQGERGALLIADFELVR